MTRQILIVLTLVIAQSIPTTAQSREKSLDRWLDTDLVPYVQQQLVKHPRFKNETVMFVVLQDNAPASSSNDLALSLRDRLLEAAIDSAGVAVGWQQGRSGKALESRPDDCLHDKVHYYIGLELSQELDSRYSVSVRALDLDDRTWVTGFGKQWHGRLSTVQRQAMRQRRVDETFVGARDVPFTLAQTDLLAANLAHQLSCTLKQQMERDYVVATSESTTVSEDLIGTVELIGNNLANRQALRLTTDTAQTNATLSGKAHQISDALYQYWLTVTPDSDTNDLVALSVSAYIVIPNARRTEDSHTATASHPPAAASTAAVRYDRPSAISIPNSGKDGLISPLTISAPTSGTDCFWPCSLLRTRAKTDSIVFFLEHQASHGLVRLAGGSCRTRTAARIARNGEELQFPIAKTTTVRNNWSETYDWEMAAESDTFYAVVVTNSAVARQLANHIDSLPLRCTRSMRPGLRNAELKQWLTEFAVITAKSSQHIDWRAIQVHDIT